MNKKIKVTENDLINLKSMALTNYKEKSVRGISPDAFWSKCVIEATKTILKLDIEIKYPDYFKEIDK